MSNLQSQIKEFLYEQDDVKRAFFSYEFFSKLIIEDIHTKSICPIVLTFGCSAGLGSKILSKMSGSVIVSVCRTKDVYDYAVENFSSNNIMYVNQEFDEYIKEMTKFDYVVSRGNIDIDQAKRIKFRQMLIFDVEYELGIESKLKDAFEYCELYYEDNEGNITSEIKDNPVMIMCVAKKITTIKEDICV